MNALQVLPFFLIILYIGLAIFVLTLAVRFVNSHERIASALEKIAGQKPPL